MTPLERRALLTTQANPLAQADYVAMLDGDLAGRAVALAYVPDRLVIEHAAFARYLAAMTALPWPSLEALGAALLEDFNDVLVPRWLRVTLCCQVDGIHHRLRLEDRQPRWANERLLTGI